MLLSANNGEATVRQWHCLLLNNGDCHEVISSVEEMVPTLTGYPVVKIMEAEEKRFPLLSYSALSSITVYHSTTV